MRGLILSCALAALVACAGDDRAARDPLRRSIGWFGIAGGEDLRAGCVPGAQARYRFVYNAVWEEQVRVYEVIASPGGEGAALRATAIRGAPRLLNAYLLDHGGSHGDETRLEPAALRNLVAALDAAGFAGRPPDGTRLQSYDFYWLVSACVDGRWHLNAWRREARGFGRLGFDELLFAADRTGVPVNPPRPVDPAQRLLGYGEAPGERGRARGSAFELVIREGRLGGLPW